MDSVTRFFASGFFMNQFLPGPVRTVSNFFENSKRYGAPPVSTTRVANNGNNIGLLRPYSELEGKNVTIS
jgi:hypothetical protein